MLFKSKDLKRGSLAALEKEIELLRESASRMPMIPTDFKSIADRMEAALKDLN